MIDAGVLANASVVRLVVLLLTLAALPSLARADELTRTDLETIDRLLAGPAPSACSEAREHLRLLRDAYGRQSSPVVQSAIAARVPMALDTLRFCVETSSGAPDAIEPARRMLAAAREHSGCGVPVASMEQLIEAWESESSEVVRSAVQARLESLSQTVRFCLETMTADDAQVSAISGTTVTSDVAPLPTIAPLPAHASGARALGSPFAGPR